MELIESENRKRTSQLIETSAARRNIDNQIKLAETILHLFRTKEKSTLMWPEVHESLKASNLNTYVDEKEYRQQLMQLQLIIPDWLQVMSLPKMFVLKQLKKTMTTFDIREQVKKYFNN